MNERRSRPAPNGESPSPDSLLAREQPSVAAAWWQTFFESPDSLQLAFFPGAHVTRRQVAALAKLLAPWRPRRALDLCCGAGRHLLPLARRGFPLVGVDVSRFMLGEARAQARRLRAPAPLVRGDARRLPFRDAAFDVVLCLFNSFGYCLSEEENEGILREVARCLEPGGRFVLDTRNRELQLSRLPFSEIVALDGGGAVWLECTHDARRERLLSTFRSAADGEILYQASIRIYPLPELLAMLSRAGLPVERVCSGYDFRPFRRDARELILLARKA
jgi:SAM-dependent methyltransferase